MVNKTDNCLYYCTGAKVYNLSRHSKTFYVVLTSKDIKREGLLECLHFFTMADESTYLS